MFMIRRMRGVVVLAAAMVIIALMAAATQIPAPVIAMQAATPAATSVSGTLPTIPAPVAVQVDPKTTAFLVLDLTNTICSPRPSCVATLPKAAALLKKARDAGALVVYSDTGGNTTILPEVAPQAGEQKVSGRADKFFGTNLDDILKGKGTKTVVIVGYVANGAVLYTSFGANIRGYTAVVAADGTGAEDPFAVTGTFYQLLNEPGFANPQNQPLVENRVTLSRSDLITFVPGAPGPKPAATTAPTGGATTAPTAAPTTAATPAPTTASTAPKNPLEAIFPPGPGRELVLSSCGSCHSVVCPAMDPRPVAQWEGTKNNHKAMVTLPDADYNQLFDYLMKNFNDKSPAPNIPDALKGQGCTTQN